MNQNVAKAQTLQVGQRIDLFKIVNSDRYGNWIYTTGTLRPGKVLSEQLADVMDNQGVVSSVTRTAFGEYPKEVKVIGALVVKGLKS